MMEIQMLIEGFKGKQIQLEKVMFVMGELTKHVLNADKMFSIEEVGGVKFVGFLTEIEGIRGFKKPNIHRHNIVGSC